MSKTLDALEFVEPDDAYLRAADLEDDLPRVRRALVVLISDHKYDEGDDGTGVLVFGLLTEAGFQVDGVVNVRSKKSDIRKSIETAVVGGVDLVLTVGGTGVGPRDKAPEATRSVIDQLVPGVGQAVRNSGQLVGAVDATTSRGICGVSGSTVVLNLAASRKAVRDGIATATPLVLHLLSELNKYSVQ